MDILTHALSGVAVGVVLSTYSTKGFFNKLGIIILGGFGGVLPDLDAISLWSGFDTTIGKFLNLSHTGNTIYFSKFWYSHHGFFHSLMASLIVAFIIGLTLYVTKSKFKTLSFYHFWRDLKSQKIILIAFVMGFIIHLIEDMPTPANVWGGVNFFWPSAAYIGGSGDIWWWNNYDIFLIVVTVIIINLLLLAFKKLIKLDLRKITTIVLLMGFLFSLYQIKTRGYDFNYSKHEAKFEECETKSKEIQKEILGDRLFSLMEAFDHKLGIYF